jgi:hypothetical protein
MARRIPLNPSSSRPVGPDGDNARPDGASAAKAGIAAAGSVVLVELCRLLARRAAHKDAKTGPECTLVAPEIAADAPLSTRSMRLKGKSANG